MFVEIYRGRTGCQSFYLQGANMCCEMFFAVLHIMYIVHEKRVVEVSFFFLEQKKINQELHFFFSP